MPDSPWWSFALDPAARVEAPRLTDDAGHPLVNPPDAEGRLGLDYPTYLALDRLLDAQTPASNVPDERAFIAIHQLCELAFKLMVFDLGVVARTCEALLDLDDDAFGDLAREPLPDERGPAAFWRPAMTAAARLRHTARHVLPSLMPYVGLGDDDDVLFSSLEYAHFRDLLAPASGFQSAQLRLIQRALAKGPLFTLPLFPGDTASRHYRGCPAGHVALTDELFLRAGHRTAYPPDDAPEAIVARLDALAHAVLARLGADREDTNTPPIVRLQASDAERVTARFRSTLGREADEAAVDRLRATLDTVIESENARRGTLGPARRAAAALTAGPPTCLSFMLDRVAATDTALHGQEAWTFLTVHRRTVRRHVSDDSGTGGGGMPYLVTSQRVLLPLFPALVAYADLAAAHAPGLDDPDRW